MRSEGHYEIPKQCSWLPKLVQCNLDYPDLVYLEPRLSGLALDQQIH